MSRGLVDGERLRIQQYLAIQDRDTAQRLYTTGRQKFRQMNKGNEADPYALPPVEITHVTDDVFQKWEDEVREEARQKLLEARVAKEKAKVVRRQEAELHASRRVIKRCGSC
jgi:hypothetical protein